jgi:hypothetical protein
MTGTLHEDRQTLMIISRSAPTKMKNAAARICTGNQNTHFILNFFSEIIPFRLCDNVKKYGTAGQVR